MLKWIPGQRAAAIYEDRSFGMMPELADALVQAGCTDDESVGHCRRPDGHVRGCRILDLLTGRE